MNKQIKHAMPEISEAYMIYNDVCWMKLNEMLQFCDYFSEPMEVQ